MILKVILSLGTVHILRNHQRGEGDGEWLLKYITLAAVEYAFVTVIEWI